MPARVLSVGNCGPDDAALRRMIETHFDARVTSVARCSELASVVDEHNCQLVLFNRIGDLDGAPGMDGIRWLQENHPEVPCMLISNYADAQQDAVASGARPGFGKSGLTAPATLERLGEILPTAATSQA